VFASAHVTLTEGLLVGAGPDAPEVIASRFGEISARHAGEVVPGSGMAQSQREITKVMAGPR
jgi:hypothetical protein